MQYPPHPGVGNDVAQRSDAQLIGSHPCGSQTATLTDMNAFDRRRLMTHRFPHSQLLKALGGAFRDRAGPGIKAGLPSAFQ